MAVRLYRDGTELHDDQLLTDDEVAELLHLPARSDQRQAEAGTRPVTIGGPGHSRGHRVGAVKQFLLTWGVTAAPGRARTRTTASPPPPVLGATPNEYGAGLSGRSPW